jgi:hypothetical protein
MKRESECNQSQPAANPQLLAKANYTNPEFTTYVNVLCIAIANYTLKPVYLCLTLDMIECYAISLRNARGRPVTPNGKRPLQGPSGRKSGTPNAPLLADGIGFPLILAYLLKEVDLP